MSSAAQLFDCGGCESTVSATLATFDAPEPTCPYCGNSLGGD